LESVVLFIGNLSSVLDRSVSGVYRITDPVGQKVQTTQIHLKIYKEHREGLLFVFFTKFSTG
jgi:hypothetical protein